MWLEIELDRTPSGALTGTVGDDGGPPLSFTGVLELVALLERLLEQGELGAVAQVPAPADGGCNE